MIPEPLSWAGTRDRFLAPRVGQMLIAASVVVIGDEPSLTEAGKPLLVPGGYQLARARPGEPTLSQSVTHLKVPLCLRFNPATVQVLSLIHI